MTQRPGSAHPGQPSPPFAQPVQPGQPASQVPANGAQPQQPVQYPQAQHPQYPQAQHPQAQHPQAQYPQYPNGQYPNGQYQYPNGQYAPPQTPYPQAQQYPAQTSYPQPGYPQQPAYPQTPQAQPAQPQPAQPQPQPVQPYPQTAPSAAPQQPTIPQSVQQPSATSAAPTAAPVPTPTQPRPVPLTEGGSVPASVRPTPAAGPTATPASPVTPVARPLPVQPRPVPVSSPGIAVRAEEPADESEDEDDEDRPPTDRAMRNAPPWLISMVVHMVLLIILALLTLPQIFRNEVVLDVTYAEELGEQLEEDELQSADFEMTVDDPVISNDLTPVDDPLAAPPEVQVTMDASSLTSDIEAPSIGLALSGREKGMKTALLAAYGGTATTEAAVKRGLEWLKRNQQADGSWSLRGPYSGGGGLENRSAATAMALLAFQGAGHTHRSGEYKRQVARGWAAMLKFQNKEGSFFIEGQGANHHRLYTHAQGTIAICELYGMTKDEKYKKAAQLAIDYSFKAQSPEGGWRYTPRVDSDTSVTGWFVMALQSARMAGLEVPSPSLDNISKYLDKAAVNGGSLYSYKPGLGATPAMTAEGLLCRQYLGWKHDDPRLRQGIDYVLVNPIDWTDQNVYYWYYATQATHHMDGDYWNRWNKVMRESVPKNQVMTGKEKGSWNASNDQWGNHGGRLFTTCLCIYMLEVYYRHLPIYKYRLQ